MIDLTDERRARSCSTRSTVWSPTCAEAGRKLRRETESAARGRAREFGEKHRGPRVRASAEKARSDKEFKAIRTTFQENPTRFQSNSKKLKGNPNPPAAQSHTVVNRETRPRRPRRRRLWRVLHAACKIGKSRRAARARNKAQTGAQPRWLKERASNPRCAARRPRVMGREPRWHRRSGGGWRRCASAVVLLRRPPPPPTRPAANRDAARRTLEVATPRAEDDEIVPEPEQSARERRPSGWRAGDVAARFASPASAWNPATDPPIVLQGPDLCRVEGSDEPGQQLREEVRHPIENSGRRLQSQSVRAFGEHQHRDDHRDYAAKGDLGYANDRRLDRISAKLSPDQQHDNGGKRRDAKARTDRRSKRHRGDRKHDDSLPGRRRVGNDEADRRGVHRAAKRPNHILDRRAKGGRTLTWVTTTAVSTAHNPCRGKPNCGRSRTPRGRRPSRAHRSATRLYARMWRRN